MIRNAKTSDLAFIVDRGLHESAAVSFLKADRNRMYLLAKEVVAGKKAVAFIADRDGVARGVIAASLVDGLWFRKTACEVLLWSASGGGVALMRRLIAYCHSKPVVRCIVVSPMFAIGERMERLLQKLGFAQHGGAWVHELGVQ